VIFEIYLEMKQRNGKRFRYKSFSTHPTAFGNVSYATAGGSEWQGEGVMIVLNHASCDIYIGRE
jgi:hypothetical protein